MICLLALIQLLIASPIMISQRKLQQAMDQTIMNRDINMAAFANYEPELIEESSSTNPLPNPFVGFITSRYNQKPRWRHSLWYEHIINDDQKRSTRYAVSYGIAVRYGSTGKIAVMY